MELQSVSQHSQKTTAFQHHLLHGLVRKLLGFYSYLLLQNLNLTLYVDNQVTAGPLIFLTTHTCHAPHRHRDVPVKSVDRMLFMLHYSTQNNTGCSITSGLHVLSVLKTSKYFWCCYSKTERTDALHGYTISQTKHKHWPPLKAQILEQFGQSKG